MKIFKHIKDVIQQKTQWGVTRSNEWPTVRKHHLAQSPSCVLCGGKKKLEVHHIKPFHLHPQLELDPTNLITLCEAKNDGINCHLLFGHLGSFKSFNKGVKTDAQVWYQKIQSRPK